MITFKLISDHLKIRTERDHIQAYFRSLENQNRTWSYSSLFQINWKLCIKLLLCYLIKYCVENLTGRSRYRCDTCNIYLYTVKLRYLEVIEIVTNLIILISRHLVYPELFQWFHWSWDNEVCLYKYLFMKLYTIVCASCS